MSPHPDFEKVVLPQEDRLGAYIISPLTPAQVYEDFAAVTASANVLFGLFGNDWPANLTLEKNLKDLDRHASEFAVNFAFSWIIRSENGRYIGCAYLNPPKDDKQSARVFTWIEDRRDRNDVLDDFNDVFREWLTPRLPDGYVTTWISNYSS